MDDRMSRAELKELEQDARVAREFGGFAKVKLTDRQLELYKGMEDAVITTVTGPPGTAKSFVSLYYAVKLLKRGEAKKIILVKPIETSGEDIGFLPGTQQDKIQPYLNSFLDNLKEMVDGPYMKQLFDSGIIEFVPVAFMRGRTFKNTVIVADECQNLDVKQLMTMVTRLGENSSMVIIGDTNQNDISRRYVALDYFIKNILGEDPSIFNFKFERADIVRHPLLIKITDNYEKAQERGDMPDTKKRN